MSSALECMALLLALQPNDAIAEPAAQAMTSAEVQSVWDFVQKGGLMMIPIIVCSLVALTVIFERFISLRRSRIIPPLFLEGLKRELNGDLANPVRALKYCESNDAPVSRVFAAGLKRLSGPIEIVEKHIDEAGQRLVLRLRKNLRILSVIAAVAPLMGLLGTIFGMITAFQTVATSGEALGRTELLAEGIYQAMITTAAGLLVAIPALVFYHWLAAKVERLVMDIDEMTVDFVEEITRDRHATQRPAATTATSDETHADASATDGALATA